MNQNKDSVIEAIMTRTSIRQYTDEKLTDAEIVLHIHQKTDRQR